MIFYYQEVVRDASSINHARGSGGASSRQPAEEQIGDEGIEQLKEASAFYPADHSWIPLMAKSNEI